MFTVSVVVYHQLGFKLQRSHSPSSYPTLVRECKARDYVLRQQFSDSQQQWTKKLTAIAKNINNKRTQKILFTQKVFTTSTYFCISAGTNARSQVLLWPAFPIPKLQTMKNNDGRSPRELGHPHCTGPLLGTALLAWAQAQLGLGSSHLGFLLCFFLELQPGAASWMDVLHLRATSQRNRKGWVAAV